MRIAVALVLCVVVAATTPLQSSALPQRAMMFSGYFGRPVPAQYYPRTYARPGFVTRGYEPQGAMSAFAAGNTVAAGSGFYGGADGNGNGNGYSNGNGNGYGYSNGIAPDCSQCNGVVPPPGGSAEQPEPEADPEPQPQPLPQPLPEAAPAPAPGSQEEPDVSQEQPALPPPSAEADDSDFPRDQPATPAPAAPPASAEVPEQESGRDFSHKHQPKPASKPGRKRPAQDSSDDDDDDDDDDEDDFPIAGLPLPGKRRKGQGNVYSSYFPMFFGGFPGGRSSGGGSGADGTPGVATAIANSFSKGKGAVATSHATAYGGPHLLGANGSNGYRKNGSKARLTSRA